ncbi:unnamed protein product [Sphenostylis stenocarpa]|uniref:Spt6 acidic N-terminal domain-containing protein n=1 Tax=Sphenostylis stenocarpa TaxID=92480 RepID=A0AA86S3Y6_9FABA|nr:unnamed protein product [Sphenostylis stenocarpa]
MRADDVELDEEEREPVDGDELEEGRDMDNEDEDEEEEGQDEYENDGFIVDDIEDEEEQDEEEKTESDEERQKRKKRKKKSVFCHRVFLHLLVIEVDELGDRHRIEIKEEYVLDEDDYELLEDNNINIHRWKESKKFKRLKKGRRDTEEEPSGLSDEEEFVGSGKVGRTAEEKLKRSLFGDDEGALVMVVYAFGFLLTVLDCCWKTTFHTSMEFLT